MIIFQSFDVDITKESILILIKKKLLSSALNCLCYLYLQNQYSDITRTDNVSSDLDQTKLFHFIYW